MVRMVIHASEMHALHGEDSMHQWRTCCWWWCRLLSPRTGRSGGRLLAAGVTKLPRWILGGSADDDANGGESGSGRGIDQVLLLHQGLVG